MGRLLVVLSQTMRGDQILFILACDGCGRTHPAARAIEGDAVDLWLDAYRRGWRLAQGPGLEFAHHCPACALPIGGPA